jgi:molecular chaperone DnaK
LVGQGSNENCRAGRRAKLIEKNTTIPTKAAQVFSTADDNQTAVTVHVLQGEREMAGGNKSLGRFDLTEIPSARRGTPQIEVTFDIDANGILNVSAKDKATGKQQSIVIKASSGLSEDEIQRMVKDAEIHAAEDKKLRELVEARNQADNLVHGVMKSLEDLGDKVESAEKQRIEAAIKDLQEAVKSDDAEHIKRQTTALTEHAGSLAQRVYQQGAAAQAADGAGAQASAQTAEADGDSNVVDADYEEVKDDDK